ncbi:MAG: winged helix-turn-helix domain-containing protein, partial [Saprospiraceae bacterium]|nr:winged helix-turn-helix domain-containing protein [Saprospiraceae bacterium]
RDFGVPYRTGVKITLDITQSDIAALIGASRKTVSLLFTDLEEAGLVKFFGRREIYVPDVEGLE